MLSDTQRAALAARLRRDRAALLGESGAAEAAGRITRRPPGLADPPATFGQEQLWFLYRMEGASAAYNIPLAVRLDGALDVTALEAALNDARTRRDSLSASD